MFYMCSIEHRKVILDQPVDFGIPVLINNASRCTNSRGPPAAGMVVRGRRPDDYDDDEF
jgi:hypothetical protein